MKTELWLFLFLSILSLGAYAQKYKPVYQTNNDIDFANFISGVKSAYIVFDEAFVKSITGGSSSPNEAAVSGIVDYLKKIGIDDVKWGAMKNPSEGFASICDLVVIFPTWNYKSNTYSNITLSYVSCNGDIFRFDALNNIWATGFTNVRTSFYSRCMDMYGNIRTYNSSQRLNLPAERTDWTEQKLKTYFTAKGVDRFEGVYESAIGTLSTPKYKVGVIRNDNGYDLIYISGATNYLDWTEGEIKSKLTATATATLFKANWKMGNKDSNNNAYVSFETGLMNLVMQDAEKSIYIKLFPAAYDNVNIVNNDPSSGTCFGISPEGLIVTNSHVINGATKIKVRGVKGDFGKSYPAKLIIEDRNNDLAIIQLIDSAFTSLGTIPFTIASKSSDVGSSVYVLGYPLKAMMGDEIKLTNGIISSKSGFQGDVTSYQISVPVQPGNSGGPLFDSNGNLIGIVNAKLAMGENVSYAIKSSYLTNLIDLLPASPQLQTSNALTGKQLTEQVKLIHKFVYIIDVN